MAVRCWSPKSMRRFLLLLRWILILIYKVKNLQTKASCLKYRYATFFRTFNLTLSILLFGKSAEGRYSWPQNVCGCLSELWVNSIEQFRTGCLFFEIGWICYLDCKDIQGRCCLAFFENFLINCTIQWANRASMR